MINNRNSGFPASTCSIRLPDGNTPREETSNISNDPEINYKKRQQLITFGHTQWGFKNWSWSVTKQELDFIDYANGKFSAGVVAFVSITVKHLGISREDVGYATSSATQKGSAIHNARKSSVTNALRETLLSFGGTIATLLLEQLESNKLESQTNTERSSVPIRPPDVPINAGETRNALGNCENNKQKFPLRKDSRDSSSSSGDSRQMDGPKSPQQPPVAAGATTAHVDKPQMSCNPRVKPMEMPNHPANQSGMKVPPSVGMATPVLRTPAPKVSYVVQRMMPPLYSVQCATPPPPPSQALYHNAYYTEFSPWSLPYDNFNRHHGNVNLRCNLPPKNFVINNSQSCGTGQTVSRGFNLDNSPPNSNFIPHSVNINSSWIKPSIFYDGFWTEQKVKNWVTDQNDKGSAECDAPTANSQNQMCHSKV